MRGHAHGNAWVTVDALLLAASCIAASAAVFAEHERGQTVQGCQNPGGRGVADTTAVLVIIHVAAKMDGAFDDPMTPAKFQKVFGRTPASSSAAQHIQEPFFLMPVVEVVSVATQQQELFGEGKIHLFSRDLQDLDLPGFYTAALFVNITCRGGKNARWAVVVGPSSIARADCL